MKFYKYLPAVTKSFDKFSNDSSLVRKLISDVTLFKDSNLQLKCEFKISHTFFKIIIQFFLAETLQSSVD